MHVLDQDLWGELVNVCSRKLTLQPAPDLRFYSNRWPNNHRNLSVSQPRPYPTSAFFSRELMLETIPQFEQVMR